MCSIFWEKKQAPQGEHPLTESKKAEPITLQWTILTGVTTLSELIQEASKRVNTTCVQISITIAGHLQFWDLQKDMSLTPEFWQQAMTVKKIHLDINHEATIGFLTETQSACHHRDAIEADARATFNIGPHIPISVQERKLSLSPPATSHPNNNPLQD